MKNRNENYYNTMKSDTVAYEMGGEGGAEEAGDGGSCLVRDRNTGHRAHINPCFEMLRASGGDPALSVFTAFIFLFALALGRVILFPEWSWWWSLLFAVLCAMVVSLASLVLKKTKSEVMPKSDYLREWSRIDAERRRSWETLGLNGEKWNKRKGRPDPTGNSRWFSMPWNELPNEQREAASALGFDWKSWSVNQTSGAVAAGAEDDALLDLPGHFRGIHFSGGTRYPTERGQPWLIVIVSAELTAALWALFSIVSMIFLVRYHHTPKLLVFTLLISLAALLVASGVLPGRRFSLGWDVKGRWLLRLVALFAGIGAVVGFSLSSDNMRDYWPYYTMRHYTNVAPDEPAAAHMDAAVIVFMEGARPDVNRAIGYHRQGTTYCTAPVAYDAEHGSSDGVVSSDIQYWAIGLNCCQGTRGFSCGDSLKSGARSGIVALKQKTRAQSFFQGNLLSDNSYYEEAIKMNMAKFDLTSPEDYIMLRWVGDIELAVDELFKDALRAWFMYEGYGFLLALFVGLMMPLVIFRDEFEVHANATKAKFFKALNYPIGESLDAFND